MVPCLPTQRSEPIHRHTFASNELLTGSWQQESARVQPWRFWLLAGVVPHKEVPSSCSWSALVLSLFFQLQCDWMHVAIGDATIPRGAGCLSVSEVIVLWGKVTVCECRWWMTDVLLGTFLCCCVIVVCISAIMPTIVHGSRAIHGSEIQIYCGLILPILLAHTCCMTPPPSSAPLRVHDADDHALA